MKMAADNVTRVTLELGGNDPALVLADARLDRAALQKLVVGSFTTAGQACMGIKRIYVHRSRYDELVQSMSEILSAFRVGHGLKETSTMGPPTRASSEISCARWGPQPPRNKQRNPANAKKARPPKRSRL
jgi:acyl-CoA reductase-like NAD-dependent aldehyde dehydrogenase